MPFRMQVASVQTQDHDITISGQLSQGSYIGPEAVQLGGKDGRRVQSRVTRHEILHPADWPVVPGDGSTLVLTVAHPGSGFELDTTHPVIGMGNVVLNSNRIDISEMLADPAFWAIWMPLHLECKELPEPARAWGITAEEASTKYLAIYQSHWNAGVWPFVRFAIGHNRYAEIEYSAGIDYQNRIWIGDSETRVLLGYDSGHFSFPALRLQEVLQIAEKVPGPNSLLLLAGAYLQQAETLPADQVASWLRRSPGFQVRYLDAVVSELAKYVVKDLRWHFTETHGWINNSKYSQRNPDSPMSILSTEDFSLIREFFDRL